MREVVGHGQESVETITPARISAFDLKEHNMDLATMCSLLTSVSAISHVNLPKSWVLVLFFFPS